jgi:hypothetical protein
MATPDRIAAALAALPLFGCVTTMGSGIEPAALDRPPYYAGSAAVPVAASVAHAPITYQRGAIAPAGSEPSAREGSAMAGLLAELNARLDGMGLSAPLSLDGVPGRPPDVRFGCHPPAMILCPELGEHPEPWARPIHWLHVTRPSRSWIEAVARVLETAGATHVLILTVELSEYWPRALESVPLLELGSGHVQELRWYTDPQTPVNVLQLTGALLDADGRALRIGAEGLMARPTGLLLTVLGAQASIRESDIEWLRTARREELPGAPLVWDLALRTLVERLLAGAPGG